MRSNIESQLHAYIHLLNAAQKKSLLGLLKAFMPDKKDEAKFIEQYNKELEEADAAINRGEFYTNEEVQERLKKIMRSGK